MKFILMMALLISISVACSKPVRPGSLPHMGRVWQSGFETANTGDTEWFSLGEVITQARVRSGLYAHLSPASIFDGNDIWGPPDRNLNLSECYARVCLNVSGLPSEDRGFFKLYNSLAGQGVCGLTLNTDGTVTLSNDSGFTPVTIGTSTTVLQPDTWYVIEVHAKVSSTVGVLELKIDDKLEVSASNLDTGTVNILWVSCGPALHSDVDFYIDDIAINSTAGTVNNSWCGDGHIVMIKPDSDTATINWTAQNAGSHFAEIDELPGTPDITTYIKTTSTTLNLEDRWNFSNLPVEVDLDVAKIKAICFGARGGGTGTTTRTAKFQARDASNNIIDGTNVDWNLNGWKTVYPILSRNQTWEGSPADLTPSYVNGIQGAAIDTNTNNREIRWTVVWASVEYLNPTPVMQAMRSFLSPIFTE